ncbi:MAG: GGDEF domain-containing protein [Solirubrobacterales bacterium]|nr:GGDEF domain-containing protein [Solirubrobacterales bacterium]
MRRDDQQPEDRWRPYVGAPAEHNELETFEREYTIESFSQRDLMLDLGAVLWFMLTGIAIGAGRFDDAVETTLQAYLSIVIAVTSAVIAVSMLTWIRRLDDERTTQVVGYMTVYALFCQFALSFYGPGALGAMVVGQVAVVVYSAQFLSARGLTAILALTTVFAGLGVYYNYEDPAAPHFLSQTVLMIIVLWAVGYSVHVLKQDRAEALEESERTAFGDPLTGLPNTRMLRRRASALLDLRNERLNRQIGLIVLDLDGFRAANMLNGHRDGDRLLLAAADAMREAALEGEFVARTGSDEFSVLTSNAERASLEARGAEFRAAVLGAIDQIAGQGVNIDASVGVALSGEGDATFESLLRNADRALYLVKAEHERHGSARRTSLDEEPVEAPWTPSEPPLNRPLTRRESLRWRNRPTQVKFTAISWLLSTLAVAISLAMPDAVSGSSVAIAILVAFGALMAATRYCTNVAHRFSQQLLDVLIASVALALTIQYTGNTASPALPIALLILIYVGWFLPLKRVLPVSIISLMIIFTPYIFGDDAPAELLDIVTIIGGVLVAAALLLVLYYNHYFLERAQTLTAQLSSLDPRAGTYNRRAFEERMRVELDHLSYGDRDALAVLMIDLGNFKSVSANYGRLIGDQMLTEVAAALTAASREEDCIARLGGDEFGIVAPGVDAESARALAQRLVDAVRVALQDSDLPSNAEVRPSAGFALYGMHGRTTDELVTAADIALTAAKTSGRDPNRVSSFVVAL